MKNIPILIFIGVLVLAGAATAENEAVYTPDGLLTIPHVDVLDAAGTAVASYEVTMQKETGRWRFELVTVTDLPLSDSVSGTDAILTSGRILYIPHALLQNSSGQTLRNYAVYMRRDSSWRFTLYGITDLDSAGSTGTGDTGSTDTNVTTNVTADVAGTWDFSFTKSYNITNSGTAFGNTTEMTPYSAETITLTLEQTDEDVTGTGTGTNEFYTLSGQVAGDLFSFSLLTGFTNGSMSLTSGHVAVGDGTMGGDYYANTEDLNGIETGSLSAEKQ